MRPSVVRPTLAPHTGAMTDTMILDAIDAFLARDVAPHVHALEHDDIYPEAIVARMRELGLFGATIAADGGLGLPCATYADVVERIARVWMSLTGIFNSHLIMSAIVQRHGTERSEEHTSESSHMSISYAVFCLKKKKKKINTYIVSDQQLTMHLQNP